MLIGTINFYYCNKVFPFLQYCISIKCRNSKYIFPDYPFLFLIKNEQPGTEFTLSWLLVCSYYISCFSKNQTKFSVLQITLFLIQLFSQIISYPGNSQ